MPHTLDICGNRTIQNPSEADIRAAVLSMDPEKNDAFLILATGDLTYIQTSGDPKNGFQLEYQEGDIQHHYQARRDYSVEEIIRALVSYLSGGVEWKNTADWEHIRW